MSAHAVHDMHMIAAIDPLIDCKASRWQGSTRLIASGLLWPATSGAAETMIFLFPPKTPAKRNVQSATP